MGTDLSFEYMALTTKWFTFYFNCMILNITLPVCGVAGEHWSSGVCDYDSEDNVVPVRVDTMHVGSFVNGVVCLTHVVQMGLVRSV